jgi:predicted dehydrogenase
MKERITRRQALRQGAAASAAAATWPPVRASATAIGSEPLLRVAVIGAGWYGKTDLYHLTQVCRTEVVGVCDVDERMRVEACDLAQQWHASSRRPVAYDDFRTLLQEQRPSVVLVATPDHWHCLPTVEACRAGADVYVQKPISVDVVEGQAMVAAARKYGRTVQVGLQRRSTPHLLEARDKYVASGRLGKVAFVDLHSYYGVRHAFPATAEPPAGLDWSAYVGPAPWVDYRPEIHPRAWRSFRAFGNGQMGDLCVHFFDLTRFFLGLGWPQSIAASGGRRMDPPGSAATTADTQTAVFDYGDVQVVWTQRSWGQNPDPAYPWGATFYGDQGTLKLSVRSYDFYPQGGGAPEHGDFLDEREQYPADAAYEPLELFAAPATRRNLRNFLEARAAGTRPVADVEEGHISSACCILANLSMDLGRSLRWDAQAQCVAGDEEANRLLARAYREPWIHPTDATV